jgi:hypothetical protein
MPNISLVRYANNPTLLALDILPRMPDQERTTPLGGGTHEESQNLFFCPFDNDGYGIDCGRLCK